MTAKEFILKKDMESVWCNSEEDMYEALREFAKFHVKEALKEQKEGILKAWEALPEGHFHIDVIENWIIKDLHPTIIKLRESQFYSLENIK